jgi:indole-3-glycerol phosphate synthase
MPSILDKIVAEKRQELTVQKEAVSPVELERMVAARPETLDFAGALCQGGVRLIAEVKKASPSRGLLCPDFDPVAIAQTYVANGASALSVLTDPRFQGELDHIVHIKHSGASGNVPVLRKDFIFDPYQVFEARAAGADALLLIVAILDQQQLAELLSLAGQLGLQCLVEVHDRTEVEIALQSGARVVGINNRDLRTFTTDLAVTEGLAPLIPPDRVIVSESGINAPEQLSRLEGLGVAAVLVGEALVTAPDIGRKVRELTGLAAPFPQRTG